MTWDQWLLLGAVILWALFLWVLLISNIVFRWKAYSVVRCKNCRKYDTETHCCKFWPDEGYRHPDHFCGEAERRDDHEST